MIHLSTSLSYYKRPEIQKAIVQSCENREVAVRFGDNFGKRPDILVFPSDVLEVAKNGATSFHVSEEHWENPLVLSKGLSRKELDSFRIGWDLVLDIDAKNLEISKLVSFLLVSVLEENGVKGYSIKYSGNKGFHIGVGFEAFPEIVGGKKSSDSFPDIPKKVASYLIVETSKKINVSSSNFVDFSGVKKLSFDELRVLLGSDFDKVFEKKEGSSFLKFNPHNLINLDTVLISSRHMYRCAYSLHEKTGLVSLPISKKEDLLSFDKNFAKPSVVKGDVGFLDSVISNEGTGLLVRAYDSLSELPLSRVSNKPKFNYDGVVPQVAVGEGFFPPCVKKILEGLEDGRKRSLFILINFLRSLGWDRKSIESRISFWNSLNREPLSDGYVSGQIKYSFDNSGAVLPPNCDNPGYYRDLGVKCSEDVCCKVKNPVVFSSRKMRFNEGVVKKGVKKKRKVKEKED